MSDQAINQENGRIARLLLAQDVAEFLYREAEILDERRYEVLADNCRRFLAGQELRNIVDKSRWF